MGSRQEFINEGEWWGAVVGALCARMHSSPGILMGRIIWSNLLGAVELTAGCGESCGNLAAPSVVKGGQG